MRAEDAQGTPTQSHMSPSMPVYAENAPFAFCDTLLLRMGREEIFERDERCRKRYAKMMIWVGEVPPGEKMLYSGTNPESHITEYTLVYEDYNMRRTVSAWLLEESKGS